VRELLVYIARALVDHPDAVKVEEFEEDDGTLVLELSGGRRHARARAVGGRR
jgi:uncharacterized protein